MTECFPYTVPSSLSANLGHAPAQGEALGMGLHSILGHVCV